MQGVIGPISAFVGSIFNQEPLDLKGRVRQCFDVLKNQGSEFNLLGVFIKNANPDSVLDDIHFDDLLELEWPVWGEKGWQQTFSDLFLNKNVLNIIADDIELLESFFEHIALPLINKDFEDIEPLKCSSSLFDVLNYLTGIKSCSDWLEQNRMKYNVVVHATMAVKGLKKLQTLDLKQLDVVFCNNLDSGDKVFFKTTVDFSDLSTYDAKQVANRFSVYFRVESFLDLIKTHEYLISSFFDSTAYYLGKKSTEDLRKNTILLHVFWYLFQSQACRDVLYKVGDKYEGVRETYENGLKVLELEELGWPIF